MARRSLSPERTTATIPVDVMRTAALRIVVSPLTTLLLLCASSVGDGADVPAWLRRRILSRLRATDVEALLPIRPGAATELPDFAAGAVEPGQHRLRDELDRVLQQADAGERQLAGIATKPENAVWVEATADPKRWTHAYIAALVRAWPAVEPVWRSLTATLHREVQRAAVAAAFGAQTELLTGIWPGCRVDGGRFAFDVRAGHWPAEPRLRDGTLILTPMLGLQPRRLVGGVVDNRPRELRDLTYAITLDGRERSAADVDSLAALVGEPRSRILRSLTLPRDMTAVAEVLQSVPSSASRHVSALERAGLVERRADGRHVRARLTARGEALLRLYR
ncbi:MAG TPA: winged helix-turn-helix domain-containing protein [Solirubrobacter sp.]|nr:winged helix-turn-helix domain-containing protein [Solirubrobacter sp.]